MHHLITAAVRLRLLLSAPRPHRARGERGERGDVPGWVLVTLMSVTLVTAIGIVAQGELTSMLHSALSRVK